MRDKVTISLYSVESNDALGYKPNFLNEFANIEKIRNGLVNAAKEAGRQPPEIILSILLVPDWSRKDNSYIDDKYLDKKYAFLDAARQKFEAISDVTIQDFYSECVMSDQERQYMANLKAMGSNADMIKTRAIINNADQCRHLQIDSNTVVPSYKELYDRTFNAEIQKDGLNGSYYDDYYVSAHNKMVYSTPNGEIAKSKLEIYLWEWCKDHLNDDTDKQANKNSIYAKVFTKALHEIIYTEKFSFEDGKSVYPATLNPNIYWLTNCMFTAINMSWSSNEEKEYQGTEQLKQLPSITVGDATFNFQCFYNIIKKHTGDLSFHSKALKLDDLSPKGEKSRELLLDNSNRELELNSVKQFYENALQNCPESAHKLSKVFPANIEGNNLTRTIFGCDVSELREQAKKISNSALSADTSSASSSSDNKIHESEQSTNRNFRM